jgi:outer membrane protein OmpA-like peptidoglycan-associated protein
MPASLTDYDNSSGVTAKLYQGLSERLKEANLNIKTSYTAGSISIAIEDNFLFSNDSSVISEKSKDRLHNLIVIYTEELFSDPEIREKISSVQFVGHASPRYRGVYLSPDSQNEEGYKHNITLSANRALEVVNYIYSGDFSDFPYKEELRSKIVVSGKGHQEPIALRQIASEKQGLCGPYDCQKSRRVEIIFSLKADESIDN